MDTLSSSISTAFRVPTLHHPTATKSHLRRNPRHHVHPRHFSISSSSAEAAKRPSPTTTTLPNRTTTTVITPKKQRPEPSKSTHLNLNKAASGYAVALLDAARGSGALHLVGADVRRLSGYWLRNEQLRQVVADPRVEGRDKKEIIGRVLKQGGYHKHVVKLAKLLVEKDKVGILLSDVLAEFGRIYGELRGGGWAQASAAADANKQVVLVPADVKLKDNQAMEIARRVGELSGGAAEVVVRRLVDHSRFVPMPS